jgi:hypothetical protein
MTDAVTHSTTHDLAAFDLGKLPQPVAAAVAAHLESCTACRQAATRLHPGSSGTLTGALPACPALTRRHRQK